MAVLFGAGALAGALGSASLAHAEAPADLSNLSIEELGDIQVTSVSKRAQAIGEAPSAIFVISRDDIARSGATTLPEALRLAPNLEVAQSSASRYVITARGFNGVPAAQNFSNKLLVLIDGRSVYSPLFSGVYWDMQDVILQDVERIEVISGPGATLWGANAVNGVINIITRPASETQGGLFVGGGGDRESGASLRLGGRQGATLSWRLYAKLQDFDEAELADGAGASDGWRRSKGGFRVDWAASPKDAVTLQGDIFTGKEDQAGAPPEDIRGRNILARWSRTIAPGSQLQVQGYYDRAERGAEVDGSGFQVDTYDIDLQHDFKLGRRHDMVWGGGYRWLDYGIDNSPGLQWMPAARNLSLYSLFAQDTVVLGPTVNLVLGVKLEDDPYIDAAWLPNARLSWAPSDRLLFWAAASRAIRSPTPFDRDVVEKVGAKVFLKGGENFQGETLTAYELGTKVQISRRSSVSLSGYYNDYEHLRSIETTPVSFLPLMWGNGMTGRTLGVEAWGDLEATPWWRLSASVSYLDEDFKFAPGASGLLGPGQAANDPTVQAGLKSSMRLGEAVSLDGALRYVSELADDSVPAYTELNARLGWAVSEHVELSLSGRNLLHDRHLEYTQGAYIPRSVFADLRWRF